MAPARLGLEAVPLLFGVYAAAEGQFQFVEAPAGGTPTAATPVP